MNSKQQAIRAALAVLFAIMLVPSAHSETLTRTTAFEYDPVTGSLIREVVEPDNSNLCLVTIYTYDAYGNRNSTNTRNCNGTSSGGLTEAAAPTGHAVFATRTTSGVFAAGTQTVGGSLSWAAGQFPTAGTNALGHAEAREFDPRFGSVTKLTGPNGLATTWTYDAFGRRASETRADGTTINWAYTNCGACPTHGRYFVTETSANAPTRSSYFDALNREIRSEVQGFDGTLIRKDTEYDNLGRVARVSKPYYAGATPVWTTFQYDILGRTIQAEEPATSAGTTRTVTTFNALVTTVTVSNAGGTSNMPATAVQTRTTTKNSQGQVMTVADTQANTITYTYDPFGNLKTTNAGGVITTLSYDLRSRKTQMIDPDMGTWNYAFNALGELVWQQDAKSQITTMTYDKLGRITQRTEADLVSNWSYDTCTKGIGKPCQVTADNGYSRTITYDSLGRVSSLATTVDTSYTVSYTYDSSGRPDTMTYPTGFAVQNVYNARGYLWKVQRVNEPADTTVYWTANSHSAAGQVTSELLGNTLTTTRAVDALFRVTEILSTGSGGDVHRHLYTFDAIGNVITRQDTVQAITENFTFDTLNRLLTASGSGLTTRTFAYSAIGNMTSKSDVGAYTYPAVSAARPHAVSSVTNGGTANSITASYGYDANGSLTSASGTIYPSSGSVGFSRTLTYTSFNMPATISQTQGASSWGYTYTYSAEHERMRLVTVRPDDTLTSIYLHPAGKGALLYEKETRQSDGRIEHKHYVNGGAGLVGVFVTKSSYSGGDGPQMRYYHTDHLGSIVRVTNPSAGVIESFAYEAFGERRNPNGTPQDRASPLFGVTTDRGFTAHEHLEELNLIHMNGRIYDPAIARFMVADPFLQAPTNLQSHNRYSYVVNNPLMYTDPSGYLFGEIRKIGRSINRAARNFAQAAKDFIKSPTIENSIKLYRQADPAQRQLDRLVMKYPALYMAGQMAATYFTAYCGGCGGVAWSAYYGYLATGSVNEGIKAGAITAATQYANSYVDGMTGLSPSDIDAVPYDYYQNLQAGNILGRAAVGCASSEASGGHCGSGAATGALKGAMQTDWGKDIAGKIWAAPNSALGLAAGVAGIPFGAEPVVGNNSIQFLNYPLGGGALTLGNVVLYGGGTAPGDVGNFYNFGIHNLGAHEMAHTFQYERLGPLFLPAYFLGGGGIGRDNPLEVSAHRYAIGKSYWPAQWSVGPLK
jgi:RHS repeat-associated protein